MGKIERYFNVLFWKASYFCVRNEHNLSVSLSLLCGEQTYDKLNPSKSKKKTETRMILVAQGSLTANSTIALATSLVYSACFRMQNKYSHV
jgi:hypothetical protein